MTDEEQAAQAAEAAAAAKARGDEIENADEEAEKVAAAEAARITAEEAAAKKLAEDAEAAAKAKKGDDEETDAEKADREAEEAAEAAKKRTRIPLSRHEQILDKARQREEALLNRVQELEKKDVRPQKDVLAEMKTKIGELQDKYEAHVFEGEKAEAKAVRIELEALRDQFTDAKVSASGNLARQQTIEELKYEAALASVEAAHPALNQDHELFDEDKTNEVADLLQMFRRSGLTRHAALDKAVKYVMGPAAAKKDGPTDTAADTLKAKREAEARQKAADAVKKQPQNTNLAGDDNDKHGNKVKAGDPLKMTQEQFAKFSMDEEALAKARGDEV